MKTKNWRIISWNINSVRLRQDKVARLLKRQRPDFLCLQEIKCTAEEFPQGRFHALGYRHQLILGQKGYHGVAILARHAFDDSARLGFGVRKAENKDDARHICGYFKTASGVIALHNFYVPAGGDDPCVKTNPKFAHKIAFVKDMEKFFSGAAHKKSILLGDLNIAPYEHDVWSHRQLLNVVSHTPIEVAALKRVMAKGGFDDIARRFVPLDQKLYSWWSYRARDWRASDRGRRLDHIWTSRDLTMHASQIFISPKHCAAAESPLTMSRLKSPFGCKI